MIVTKLSSNLHFINTSNRTRPEFVMTANKYFTYPFTAIMNPNQLSLFVVLDNNNNNEINNNNDNNNNKMPRGKNAPIVLSDVEVVRDIDLGNNDDSYVVACHFSHLLSPGDNVLGNILNNLL